LTVRTDALVCAVRVLTHGRGISSSRRGTLSEAQMLPMQAPQPNGELQAPDQWHDLAASLDAHTGTIMVVGGVDSGKTTLCWWLAEQLGEHGRTGVVDADIGQSVLGPPGTVGWRMLDSGDVEFVFVGDITPSRRPLGTVAATVRACGRARAAGAAWLVLDTSGYVDGAGATALKRAKLDLVEPTDLVLIEDKEGRLEQIARAVRPGELRVHRLAAVAENAKSREFRRRWRQERFADYLGEAEVQAISLEGRAIYGGDPRRWRERGREFVDALRGLLIGLSDAEGIGVAIGLLRGLGERGEELLLLAPPLDEEKVASVSLGNVRLEPDGTAIT
jgi:polynucleotide 5'-hydroxyl-kinase GRC3/NOL9